VIGPPGSILWLASHELRLSWRGLIGGPRGRRRLIIFGILGAVFALVGVQVGLALRGLQAPINPITELAVLAVTGVIFTLMLSQTLAGAAEALYARGDLDLLFSSPLSPRKTLTVRFLALAANAFAAFALLIAPFLLPIALVGHPAWLGAFAVLADLALMASAIGLVLAVGLFALVGPRRTRTVAQVLAALIGAAIFLTAQLRNILGGKASTSLALQLMALGADPRFHVPPLADWPLRAALGEPLPLAVLTGLAVGLFALASAWLTRRFAADTATAQGADTGRVRARAGPAAPFARGAFAATFVKELRLLRRDIALLSQVLLRVLYLLPAAFVLLRNAGNHAGILLPGGAAVLAFLAGQVAGSLTWITVSAEDAPELLACAPARPATVRRAKLAAGLTPLVVLLAGPLIALIVMAPLVGVAATAGAAAAAGAAGLINAWHPSPGKRSEFRRRRSGSILIGWAQLIVSAFIAGATGLAAAGLVWALLPAIVAGLILLALRRPDAAIAEAFSPQA
jgi:ABC-2 type transport system permease protein